MKTLNKINQIFELSIRSLITPAIAVMSILTVTSCAGDKDQIAYNQQQEAIVQAQYAAVNGSYAGPVVNLIDGSTMGALQLSVTANSTVINSSDNLGQQLQAVMTVGLQFSGATSGTVGNAKGYFDPGSNRFNAIIPVIDEAGVARSITVDGTIQSGQFSGQVYMSGYPKFGGSTTLVLNAPFSLSKSAYDQKSKRVAQLLSDNLTYTGSYPNPVDGSNVNMSMTLTSSSTGQDQMLLRVFNPSRMVAISLDMIAPRLIPPIQFTGPLTTINDFDANNPGPSGSSSVYISGQTTYNSYAVTLSCSKILSHLGSSRPDLQCTIKVGDKVTIATLSPVAL